MLRRSCRLWAGNYSCHSCSPSKTTRPRGSSATLILARPGSQRRVPRGGWIVGCSRVRRTTRVSVFQTSRSSSTVMRRGRRATSGRSWEEFSTRVERTSTRRASKWRGNANLTWRGVAWGAGAGACYIGSYHDTGATTSATTYGNLGRPGCVSEVFDTGLDR